jgi:hypothetical protein
VPDGAHAPQEAAVVRLRFDSANQYPTVAGGEWLPGSANYFIGNDTSQWRTGLPTYRGIVYRQLYPGVDLHYDGTDGRLKGTYVVAPTPIPAAFAGVMKVRRMCVSTATPAT